MAFLCLLTVKGNHLETIFIYVFFFQAEDGIRDVAVTGVQTCALPLHQQSCGGNAQPRHGFVAARRRPSWAALGFHVSFAVRAGPAARSSRSRAPARLHHLRDRKSTRLNSSHGYISYAVFCLKKNKQ